MQPRFFGGVNGAWPSCYFRQTTPRYLTRETAVLSMREQMRRNSRKLKTLRFGSTRRERA